MLNYTVRMSRIYRDHNQYFFSINPDFETDSWTIGEAKAAAKQLYESIVEFLESMGLTKGNGCSYKWGLGEMNVWLDDEKHAAMFKLRYMT